MKKNKMSCNLLKRKKIKKANENNLLFCLEKNIFKYYVANNCYVMI